MEDHPHLENIARRERISGGIVFRLAICGVLLANLLGGCATFRTSKEVNVTYQAYPESGIPAFVANVKIKASLGAVMAILMDFSSWPDWAYGCERVEVLKMIGYTEAYLYQVTRVPVIRDRDSILHATSSSSDGTVTISFEAAPDYCVNNLRSACDAVNESRLVRVTDLSGTFVLTRISANEVDVTWQQHQDPAGRVPDFVVRWMQGDIPVQSLRRLKALAEAG